MACFCHPSLKRCRGLRLGLVFGWKKPNMNCLTGGNFCLGGLGICPPGSSRSAAAQPGPLGTWPGRSGGKFGDLGNHSPCDALSLLAPLLLWVQPVNWGTVAVLSTPVWHRAALGALTWLWRALGKLRLLLYGQLPGRCSEQGAGSVAESCWGAGSRVWVSLTPFPQVVWGRGCRSSSHGKRELI